MSASTAAAAFLISFLVAVSPTEASSPWPVCHLQPHFWLNNLHSTSPLYCHPLDSPLQVDGDFLDRTEAKLGSDHLAILFHASWCPFSREAFPLFETISFMFPEIEHFTIEQSSAMPSVLSRYGIHSFPAILIVNHSSFVRYPGPRNLSSLVHFYKETTGVEPVHYMITDHPMSLSGHKRSDMLTSSDVSLKKMLTLDPYLAFSILFIFLRLLHFVFPGALACTKSIWHKFVIPQINMDKFGEASHIIGRALHMIDVKSFWTKLKLCKTRNFHQRARCASVWASSLASVSVGEN